MFSNRFVKKILQDKIGYLEDLIHKGKNKILKMGIHYTKIDKSKKYIVRTVHLRKYIISTHFNQKILFNCISTKSSIP